MGKAIDDIMKLLTENNIQPTIQRMKILEYLSNNHTHPTADQIHSSLLVSIPTLSKMTVYNTLYFFVEHHLVNVFKSSTGESHYDLMSDPHGHFHCSNCNSIYDVSIKNNIIEQNNISEFLISSQQVYLTGLCPDCNKKLL